MESQRRAADEFRAGWHFVSIAMLGCGLGVSSLPLYTAGVFVPELERSFGWTRSQLSASILVFTLTLAAASPIVGRIVDRFGVKRSALFSVVAAALCYLVLAAWLSSLWLYYAAHIGIAGLGAAAAPVAYTRIIAVHFTAARGLALGMTLLGPSIAAALAPSAVSAAIASLGWKGGYLLLAALTGAVIPALLLLREGASTPSAARPIEPEAGATGPALRTATLLHFLAAFGIFSLGVGGMIVHFVPLLTDAGVTIADAARLAGVLGIAGIIGRLVGGYLADHLFAPLILSIVAVAAAAGCIAIAVFGVGSALFAAVAVGFSLGAEADLMGYVVSRYVPRARYGRVFGWIYAAFIVGIGVSPMLLSLSVEQFGNYTPGLLGCGGLLVAAAVMFARFPSYPVRAALSR